ncbi:signal peptidase I [Haloprofundus sp. MHR1]|uniref:signal peptidase I n=1 Tax=Haloprofundus sp. MHR1 TaxID=2572921 RepID=UPI0010BEA176|nr:signal peptidase I [Haloprofundus sp. MHR1]QCJ48233.1 signal peptidase I [Haloprofundus sp. MHR1]
MAPGRKRLSQAVELLLLVVVICLLAGQLLGQPILLSYVETGSMEPTIQTGDGFIAIPAELSGPVEEGDVVTFRAEDLHGGGLTTHRVIGESDRGYVTKGDANPFVDQEGEEPPVPETKIVAVALQVDGTVVTIPHLGTGIESLRGGLVWIQQYLASLLGTQAVMGPQGLAYLFFALCVAAYVVESYRSGGRTRSRSRARDSGHSTRLVLGALAALLVVTATAAMVVPAGVQQYGVVSADRDAEGARVILQGTSEETMYPVVNGGLIPVVSFVEPRGDGVDVTPREVRVESGEVKNATVTLTAPPETGYYRMFVVEHRYLALLPMSVIRAGYAVHPWVPIVLVDAMLGGAFYLVGRAVVGTGRVRTRSKRPTERLSIRKLLRSVYER